MKKTRGFNLRQLLTAVVVMVLLITVQMAPLPAWAETPVAESITLGATTGTASWTNAWPLCGAKLVSVEVFNNLLTNNVVTVTRIRGTRTNTVCAVTCSGGAGIYREATNTVYTFYGDVLNFSSSTATGGAAEVVFEKKP